MLHIVTPLFRYELLDSVYGSIPSHGDIVWHIAKTSRRPRLDSAFVYRDPRIRLYEIDCRDDDIVTKRNTIFEHITDGYFYLLDDDTRCVEEMYAVYKEYSAARFEGMIVGANNISPARMPTVDPAWNRLDTGAVICFHSVLAHVQWQWSPVYARDRYFWSRCFAYLGPEGTVVVDRTISVYNHFGPLIKVRKAFLGAKIEWDICNESLAKAYLMLADAKYHSQRLLRWRPLRRKDRSAAGGLRSGFRGV
jgi:hypothetical protein